MRSPEWPPSPVVFVGVARRDTVALAAHILGVLARAGVARLADALARMAAFARAALPLLLDLLDPLLDFGDVVERRRLRLVVSGFLGHFEHMPQLGFDAVEPFAELLEDFVDRLAQVGHLPVLDGAHVLRVVLRDDAVRDLFAHRVDLLVLFDECAVVLLV